MGSKEILSRLSEILPEEKRLSVTVGIVLPLSGDKVLHRCVRLLLPGLGFEQKKLTYPLVRAVGPTLLKKLEVSIKYA